MPLGIRRDQIMLAYWVSLEGHGALHQARAILHECWDHSPEENFTAQSLLLHGYGAIKELNESSHFSLVVVFFGLKHFSLVSPKIPWEQ